MKLFLLAAVTALASQAQEPTFRVDVQLVRLLTTVKDQTGAPVSGLSKKDFALYDNGAKQEITLFERHTSQPLSVGVLIDISGSTAKELKYETESVQRFLKALFKEGNPDDRASLYSFNWEVARVVDYSRRLDNFDRRLKTLKAEAGTSMYDAIFLASEDIQEREGRHVLIVVTDGGDTISSKNYHQAMEAAHRADAVLYPILVVPITNDAGRNVGGENALTTMSQTTGGKMFVPTVRDLDSVFEEILRDLRTQYLIGYYPKNVPLTKNRFHKLELKVADQKLRAVTRTGYYGDAESNSR